ncbi:MAG TPA: hypothetical protein VMJ10_18030 [Kofleriaceae bacterium]|nr:hypothetical protein [Kofleriaceae bacterium]
MQLGRGSVTRHYWFAEGGRRSAAIVRIAIATSVLMVLARLRTLSTVEIPGPASLYHPVGVWLAFGDRVPPPDVVAALWLVAWASTLAMLVGLCSRIAAAASVGSALALVSLSYASQPTWSHPYNVVFLAQLAFLGARGGDTLSIDAWLRRCRGVPPVDVARGYQWSLRLVQLAVAMMFASAAFDKLAAGHFTLRWALSDNLRHQLLVRFDLCGVPRTAVASWLVDDVWRYRIAALANLVSQAAPIFACVFVERPRVRAACGAAFVVETIALGLVVGLWNLHWLPLAAVFVDWDRGRSALRAPCQRPRLAVRAFITAFVTLDLATSLVPRLDTELGLYPFSSFPMFSSIRAAEPYGEHLPYAAPGVRYEVIADRPLDARQQRWFDYQHRTMYTVRDPDDLHARMLALMRAASARYPESGIHEIRAELVIFETPAYPASARFAPHAIATIAEIGDDGAFATRLGQPATRVDTYFRDDRASPVGPDDDPCYVVVDGWLAQTRR